MKQDYTMYIYKTDRRTRTGERLIHTSVWTRESDASMKRECNELVGLYPASSGYRFEYHPKMKTVVNLMTGKEIQIDYNTPRVCDPSSESYWTM